MGLYVSHGCWDGGYIGFMFWRRNVALVAELPPLDLMDGFCVPELNYWLFHKEGPDHTCAPDHVKAALPIRWDCLKPDPLHILLRHSDCGGSIKAQDTGPIADRLRELLDEVGRNGLPEGVVRPDLFAPLTQRFITGLRAASAVGEDVEFH